MSERFAQAMKKKMELVVKESKKPTIKEDVKNMLDLFDAVENHAGMHYVS
jgi:hypothetical protein